MAESVTDPSPHDPASKVPVWLLPALMFLGAVIGLLLGGLLGARWAEPGMEPFVLLLRGMGTIFLAVLKALIVPLVVTSIVIGVTRMGDLSKVGRMATGTVVFFLSTTFLAVMAGMVLVNLFRPGVRTVTREVAALSAAQAEKAQQTPAQAIYDVITGMFPSNLFGAAVEGNILGLIVFSIIFAIALSLLGAKAQPVVDLFDVTNEALLKLVRAVVWLAPVGILGLVADRTGSAGGGAAVWNDLMGLGWYAATVTVGLLFHGLVVLPLILVVFARRNPLQYIAGMGQALITAFGTASSAATMAVTLRCVTSNNKVSRRAADFVVPLGTTVNMDGTALYEAVAVIFIAQTLGLELTFAQQLIILVTATLAAIGAAAIPEAGLVTMVLVLSAVGLPAEEVGLILSIDWILDRLRTTVNVWGDSIGAAVIDNRYVAAAAESPPAISRSVA